MALTMEYPIITSNLKAGYGAYGTADPFNAALVNNGAQNPVGSLYFQPAPSMGGTLAVTSTTGYCSGLWMKYVLYKSTANPAMVAGPAPVYYTDETFSTVSGVFSEGNPAATGNSSSLAGFLLPNTGAIAGIGVGTAVTAAILNNGGNGSYVWIGLMGFIPSAFVGALAVGNPVSGVAGNWTLALTTGVLRVGGYITSTPSANIGDLLATVQPF